MKPGQTIPLAIEKPAAGGRMIARVDGQIVLVSGAIPGERVTARVEKVTKSVAYAQTIAVDEPSPDRRDVSVDPLCGGALYRHIAYDRQLAIKRDVIIDAFTRIGHLDVPATLAVTGSPESGYRMRARLHARGRRLGFFREGTHDLCDVRQTGQLLPATCDLLERLMATINSLGVDAVRELEITENVDASNRVVALDTVGAVDARAIDRLADADGLTGFVSAAGIHGEPHVIDRLQFDSTTVTLRRHVLAFFQGNRYLLRDLVSHVIAQVPRDAPLVDLYAGVGLFAVSAAATLGIDVTAVEGDRYAAADLDANAKDLHVRAMHASVEEAVRGVGLETDRRGSLIVDPPRTGMSREALDGALALEPSRIIYVSCDVATLARDARRIVDEGYAVISATGFDLFPNTPHVETVVVLQSEK